MHASPTSHGLARVWAPYGHGSVLCATTKAGAELLLSVPRYFPLLLSGWPAACHRGFFGHVRHDCHGGTSRVPGSRTRLSYPWLELVKAMDAPCARSMLVEVGCLAGTTHLTVRHVTPP